MYPSEKASAKCYQERLRQPSQFQAPIDCDKMRTISRQDRWITDWRWIVRFLGHQLRPPVRRNPTARFLFPYLYVEVGDPTLQKSRKIAPAGKPLADLSIPESYRWVPPAVPAGASFQRCAAVH